MERHKIDDGRPSPEALLEEAKKEHRGKLKIFLGASPGVGKTYAMLGDSIVLKKEGLDVAVGIVETHGRKDTEALTKGFEIIPRKNILYRGITFQEMDIDAILDRNPDVILVDELAHTNIEGSRHPKRYQDVEELLDAGIDVYSTINIQHIESLNDVVSRISGIQIKETVPDRILQMADEIELIDIPPKELQKRLQEGKVYLPEQAKKAIHNFFTQSNLTALREMALRFTAERVDSQMLQLMQVQGIAENWPTRERIMVCIGDDYDGMELVRACHQTAARWKAPWLAVHVNTSNQTTLSTDTDYVTKALQLAEELGGEVITLSAEDIVGEILNFAKSRNVSHIIVGKPPKRRWYRIFNDPFAIELYKRSTFLKVILVPTGDIVVHEREEKRKRSFLKDSLNYRGYLVATLACFIALTTAFGVDALLPLRNLSLIFMLAILYVASRYGLWPALYTVVLSLFTYNFFFIDPRYTISIIHREHMLNSFFFVLVATLVSKKASRIREQVQAVQQNADRTASLYGFSKKISAASDTDTVFKAVVRHVAEIFDVKVTLLVPVHDVIKVVSGYPHLDELSRGAAMWAWKKNEPAGHSTTTLAASNWFFVPMQTDSGPIGVIGIEFLDKSKILLANQKRILDALSHQAAVAIERIQLSETISEAKVYSEAEKLRSALLSSIANDFCEPIAVVMDKVWRIRGSSEEHMDENEHKEALDTIYKEVSRMNRFVKNIVDICQSSDNRIDLKKELVNIEDILGVVEERSSNILSTRKVLINIQDDMPQWTVDPILLEQAVTNVFTNACEASNENTDLNINCTYSKDIAVIEFNYNNDKLRKDELDNIIFELSAAKDKLMHKQTNLALVRFLVCSSIIEAHEGTMTIVSQEGTKSITVAFNIPLGGAAVSG